MQIKINHFFLSRKALVVSIAIIVGLLHFVTGPNYRGPYPVFINSYLIDILLPFAMYLVLGVTSILRTKTVRGLSVLSVGVVVETLQYFNVSFLGKTFDWVDYLMYGVGVGLGVFLEKIILDNLPANKR